MSVCIYNVRVSVFNCSKHVRSSFDTYCKYMDINMLLLLGVKTFEIIRHCNVFPIHIAMCSPFFYRLREFSDFLNKSQTHIHSLGL